MMQREWIYLSNIFIFSIPCHSKVKHLSFLWHNSPRSLASEALFGVTTLYATEKTRSLLLLATGIGQPWPEKQEEEVLPGGSSTNSVGQWGSIWDNLFINININININSFWNLLVGVVVTMILIKNWKKQKSWRNFWTISGLKISANPVPKNPGIPGLKILILLGPGKGSTF